MKNKNINDRNNRMDESKNRDQSKVGKEGQRQSQDRKLDETRRSQSGYEGSRNNRT